jgi:hypothetical protein
MERQERASIFEKLASSKNNKLISSYMYQELQNEK